ncbi:Zinc finger protein 57 [Frankliniella fusca]|uniref:Zinc finger protein 57 n=1 Tax=Frankliniella fusca TaxID=407009 RepID=A0AAE1HUK3_9NEOP|nr:Zinc finger protein 57 [Frankliniella fusca]
MSESEELILGFCQLPEVQENNSESNGDNPSSPRQYEGEVITGDVGEYNSAPEEDMANDADQSDMVEFKPVIQQTETHCNIVEYKTVIEQNHTQNNIVEYKPVITQNEALDTVVEFKPAVNQHEDSSNTETDMNDMTPSAENSSERVTVSTNLVDFINQAGAELTAGTNLEDEESERPKKRRKVLPKGQYQCAECRLVCESFNVFHFHMNSHSEVELYTCQKCLYMFQDKTLYDAHVAATCKAAGSSKDKECAVCRKTFKYDSHLREHIICMHNKTPLFSCPICAQNITSWRRSIDRHMANHANNHKCPTCAVKVESAEALDAHLLESGEDHLRCKACDFTTSLRGEFFNHVNIHIPKVDFLEPMVCYKCGQRFQRTSEFNNHVRLFCKYRDTPMDPKGSHPVATPTIQLPIPEGINEMHDESAQCLEVANEAPKQIITLPEGFNNNSVIPITLTTGGEDLGQGLGPNTTVIIIPQLFMQPDGTGVISTGQGDQVIYLECLKPDQSGMIPISYEIPTDKGMQDGLYANQIQQSIVQALQAVQPVQQIQAVQAVQSSPTVQTIQSIQPVQSVSSVQPLHTMQPAQPIQSVQLLEPMQPQQQPVPQVQEMDIKIEAPERTEEDREEEELNEDVKPCISSIQTSAPSSMPAPTACSVVATPTSASSVDTVIQQIAENGGPPALVCSVCNEVLKDSETYESHVKQHDKVKPKPKPNIVVPRKCSSAFKCDQCGQGFAAKHHLEQHTITFHSDVAGIVCPVCRVGMASEKTSLNEHLAKAHKLRVEPSGKLTECSES